MFGFADPTTVFVAVLAEKDAKLRDKFFLL